MFRQLKILLTLLCATSITASSIESAFACRFTEPLTKAMEAEAQNVFRGTVIGYELITVPTDVKGAEPFRLARLKFATSKTVRGEEKKQWEVNWTNGNFGLPKSLSEFKQRYGSSFEVGVIDFGVDKYESAEVYKKFPKMYAAFGKYPIIVQGPCTDPYLKPLPSPLNSTSRSD